MVEVVLASPVWFAGVTRVVGIDLRAPPNGALHLAVEDVFPIVSEPVVLLAV